MPKPFPSTEPAWALRAYLILIGCAADRQTVTYEALARRIKRGGPNLLARPLDMISRWCVQHNLPALASLVVEQSTGMPARRLTVVASKDIPRKQSRVWEFDWFSIIPPTVEELAANASVRKGRTEQQARPRGKEAASKASKMAGKAIDRRADRSAPVAEQERRKRRLLKGPKEFRDIRRDRPKAKD